MKIEHLVHAIDTAGSPIVFGLLGVHPSTYSKSPALWNHAFAALDINARYICFDTAPDELEGTLDVLLRHDSIRGFNVTNPYKHPIAINRRIIHDGAESLDSVNTVFREHEHFRKTSTDEYSVLRSLQDTLRAPLSDKSILILGAGGTATSLIRAFNHPDRVTVHVANRAPADGGINHAWEVCLAANDQGYGAHPLLLDPTYDTFKEAFSSADIVVQATPAEKTTGQPLLPEEMYASRAPGIFLDMAYGHLSFFLEYAERHGHTTIPGTAVLLHQAVKGMAYAFAPELAARNATMADIERIMKEVDLTAAPIRSSAP